MMDLNEKFVGAVLLIIGLLIWSTVIVFGEIAEIADKWIISSSAGILVFIGLAKLFDKK